MLQRGGQGGPQLAEPETGLAAEQAEVGPPQPAAAAGPAVASAAGAAASTY